MTTWTFETLRERLGQISSPAEDGQRETFWVEARVLGVAVTHQGSFEVFLTGDRLQAASAVVRRHLQYDSWSNLAGDTFLANRIVLPVEPHFQTLAALIVSEMLRLGLAGGKRSVRDVFEDVEPIIEIALRRLALEENPLIGLVGELLALEQCLLAVAKSAELRSSVLDMWRGHQHASRDFVVGETSVEVKTTTSASSTHIAHSLAQIETQSTPEHLEARLYLLSIGLTPTAKAGLTLPDRVDAIVEILAEPGWHPEKPLLPLQLRFLSDVASYASSWGRGYEHLQMRSWSSYQMAFTTTFTPRLYDLSAPNVRLLRRADLAGTFVSPERIEYRFDLPDTVDSDNPKHPWQEELRAMIRRQLGLS